VVFGEKATTEISYFVLDMALNYGDGEGNTVEENCSVFP